MTKQELLDHIDANVVLRLSTEVNQTLGNIKRYIVNAMVSTGTDAVNIVNRAFYVVDEGTQDEVAYFENSDPFPTTTPTETYRQKVEAAIETKIGDGTIKGATITEISETNRTAYVRALLANDTEKFGYITDSNDDGTLEITLI